MKQSLVFAAVLAAAYFFCGDPAAPKTFAVSKVQFRDTDSDSAIDQGEQVVLTFNQPIVLFGPALAEAFIDYDFSGGGKGNAIGEKEAANGFPLIVSEPVSEKDMLFALAPSGYTTRFTFVLSGATMSVPNDTQVSVPFGKLLNATGGYQTIRGTPVTSEESSGAIGEPLAALGSRDQYSSALSRAVPLSSYPPLTRILPVASRVAGNSLLAKAIDPVARQVPVA
ncbi:MAG: hypothetical protein ACYC8T_00645 [Myxococcaceae bacterium]